MRLRVNNGNLPYFKFKRVLRAPPLLPSYQHLHLSSAHLGLYVQILYQVIKQRIKEKICFHTCKLLRRYNQLSMMKITFIFLPYLIFLKKKTIFDFRAQ